MFSFIKTYSNALLHLLYPHHCRSCGTDILEDEELLCIKCTSEIAETKFLTYSDNPVEKTFFGRLPLEHAGAGFYFTKDGSIRKLIFELKYKRNRQAGIYLGKKLGRLLKASTLYNDVDVLVPLPLNPKKESIRGYNQAMVICEGINSVWNKPIENKVVERVLFTATQTQKDRINRWENMQDVFAVSDEIKLQGKHILLIDDIVTTGATLEACGAEILKIPGSKLSIATVAYTI